LKELQEEIQTVELQTTRQQAEEPSTVQEEDC
jgi:hypothetical protein